MTRNRWRNSAAVFVVAGGLLGLGMQKAATAQEPNNGLSGPVKKREREVASSPAGTVKTVANASASLKGSIERVDDRAEIVDNGDGTKTARIRVVPQSFPGEKGRQAVDTELFESGGKLVSKATASPISVALSSGSADLVVVGKPGKQLRIGRPNGSGLTNGKNNGKSLQAPGQAKQTDSGVSSSTTIGVDAKAPAGPAVQAKEGKQSLEGERSNRGVKTGEGAAVLVTDVPAKRKGKNEVSFPESFGSGTELSYEVLPDAIKESIVLSSAPAGVDAPVYRFPITADGLTSRLNKDGAFEFLDKIGSVAFTIPAAFAFDSRAGVGTPGNAYTNVKTELRSDGE